jgi:hypothetical protein
MSFNITRGLLIGWITVSLLSLAKFIYLIEKGE